MIEHCTLHYFMMITFEIGYALVGAICLSGARDGGLRRYGKCNHRRDADIDGIYKTHITQRLKTTLII